jgi:hypothetical protein
VSEEFVLWELIFFVLYYCLVACDFVQVCGLPKLRFVPGKVLTLLVEIMYVALPNREEGAKFLNQLKYIRTNCLSIDCV